MNIKEALDVLEEIQEGQKTLIETGMLPRVMEDSMLQTLGALTFIINYVKDTEDLKKI